MNLCLVALLSNLILCSNFWVVCSSAYLPNPRRAKLIASFGFGPLGLCPGYDPGLQRERRGEITQPCPPGFSVTGERGRGAGTAEGSGTSPEGAQIASLLSTAILFSIPVTSAGESGIKLGSGRLESNIASY